MYRLRRRPAAALAVATRPVVEFLEARALLHGGLFEAHVNFQPGGAPVPTDYLADTGQVFGDRENGFFYGWNAGASGAARDRNSTRSPDQRYDTFIHTQLYGTRTWEMSVPNGVYEVTVGAGDADNVNSVYRLDVEGTRAIDGTPTNANHFLTNTVTVTVSDGRLTLTNGPGASNNKVDFIDAHLIEEAAPPAVSAFSAKVNFQPAGVAIPSGYVADTGLVYGARGNGLTYGWDADNRGAMRDRNWPTSPDQRYDTVAHTQLYGTRKWEIAVPNGTYTVRIVMGDPGPTNSVYRYNVEGVTAPGGTPGGTVRWFDNTVTATVSDGRLTITNAPGASNNKIDFVEITARTASGGNAAPTVSAGADRTASASSPITLAGSVSDDGLPSGTLTSTWSKVSGPGTVTFADARKPGTMATFSATGTYVLRLTASDGALSASDDLTITVGPASTAQAVVSFALVNADTGQPIPGYATIPAGATINLGSLPTRRLNVYANTTPAKVGSVRFSLDGVGTFHTENAAPYALFGDTGTWTPAVGSHTVTATPFSGQNATNVAGTSLTITFTVTDGTPTVPANLFAWDTKAPTPVARFEAQGTALNGKLYVFGGFDTTDTRATSRSDVYDLATNTWSRLPDMPLGYMATHAGVAVIGDQIYLAGGYLGDHPGPGTAQVWRFDTGDNTWRRFVDLPAARGAGGLAAVGHDLYFFGGTNQTRETDKGDTWTIDAEDPSGGWQPLAAMPNPRNHIGATSLGGKVYAVGGQHHEDEFTGNQDEVDVYDPATDTWRKAASLPAARGHINSSVFVLNGRVVVAGGTGNGNVPLADVVEYEPQYDVWVKLPSLPAGRKTPVAGVIGGKLVVATGNATGNATPTSTTWVAALANKWDKPATMPIALGEVAGGVIGKKLYLVGEGSSATLSYDLSTGKWSDTTSLARRPFVGNHHAAEVVNGKLYLFGGLAGGSGGKVQIYDPATNRWTLGADMPFATGSAGSAVIDGFVYVAGGIVPTDTGGTATTDRVARYDPANDTWTELAPMPLGRNHAAAATDGQRLYVFGGRGAGSGDANVVANGFDDVQVYDPQTDTWQWSGDSASGLAPLPQARGGTGKAVYADGRFYVMGGETLTGANATANDVYDRVDVYDPIASAWSRGPAMPTARHGIFPLLFAGRIYVAGGGVRSGNSSSNVLEVLNLG